METKHTPGPWTIFPGKYHASFVVPETDLFKKLGGASDSAEDLSEYAQEVCFIDDHHRHRSVKEQRANARLIAAAPMMLERLMQIAGFYDYEPAGPAAYGARCAVAEALGVPDWKPEEE